MLHSVDYIYIVTGYPRLSLLYSVLHIYICIYNMHSIGTGLLGCKGPIEREK